MKKNLKPIAIWLSALCPCLAHSQMSFSMTGDVSLPTGTMILGKGLSSSIAIKNIGSNFEQATFFNWSELYAIYQTVGIPFLPSYVYAFEFINSTTGYQDNNLFISEYRYLPSNTSDLGISSSEDHPFSLTFSTGFASHTVAGPASYTLVFRVFDGSCVASRMLIDHMGMYNECIVYDLPLKSTEINWVKPKETSPPPGTVYPLINNRPNNSDPPSTLPDPTFLTCTPDGCN